ncbi:F-box only protein 10-like [Rhopilema esculentum]
MKHGVLLTRPAEISLQDNNITFNNHSGICVLLGVCCTIQGNGIYHNKEHGIQTAGVGIIKENDIFGHKMAAVHIKMQGDPHVTRNRLQGIQQECVYVEDNTRGLIEQNEIHHYSFVNPIYYHQHSQVQIANNKFHVLIKQDNDGLETAIDLEYLNLSNPSPRPIMNNDSENRGPFFSSPNHEKRRVDMRRNVAISALCSIL